MPRPAVYLDECVNWYLAARLRQRGFSVATARDARMMGTSDAEQLSYATRLDAVLVSYDSMDYRRLHRTSTAHGGIVLIRNMIIDWQEIRAAMLLDWATTFPDHRSRLFRWHDLSQQLIGGLRLAGYSEDDVRLVLGQAL